MLSLCRCRFSQMLVPIYNEAAEKIQQEFPVLNYLTDFSIARGAFMFNICYITCSFFHMSFFTVTLVT